MVAEGIAAILPHARTARMPLAIEPLHPMYAADRACVNTLRQALDLCDELGEGVGVVVDAYHVWWIPSFCRRSPAPAAASSPTTSPTGWFPTRHLLLDRGMMGDGIIDLAAIRAAVERAGFNGPQEVEIFSAEDWWKRDGNEVISTCIARYATVCGGS